MTCGWRPWGFRRRRCYRGLLVLVLLGFWLWRETGSRTASLIAVALAAQSPLVLETAWWYSASSFLWAIAGILVAILGATYLSRRPVAALLMVGIGSALGLAGTTLGILAARWRSARGAGAAEPRAGSRCWSSWPRWAGSFTYRQVCKVGGVTVFHADPRSALPQRRPRAVALGYALSVPGRCALAVARRRPRFLDDRPLPAWLCIGAGAAGLAVTAAIALWPRARGTDDSCSSGPR